MLSFISDVLKSINTTKNNSKAEKQPNNSINIQQRQAQKASEREKERARARTRFRKRRQYTMPFPRKRFLDQLVDARFRSTDVRKLLDEQQKQQARRRSRGAQQQWLTGTHKGVFYRIRVPPPRRLPTIPKLHTPTLPPKRLTPVEKGPSPNAAATMTPKERQQDWWDRIRQWLRDNGATLILNFGSICTLVGFTRTDVLELRALAVTGSLCATCYHVMLTPMRYPPILWSLTFAAVNSYKIFEIVVERQGAVNLSEEQEERYISFFMPHGVTPKQFELIDQRAEILHVKKGTLIIKQHDELKHVYLVVNGSTRASILGRFLTAASTTPTAHEERVGGASGAWIGEMALLERVWLQEQGKQQQQHQQKQKAKSNGNNATTTAAATTASSSSPVQRSATPKASSSDKNDRSKPQQQDDNTSIADETSAATKPTETTLSTEEQAQHPQLKASRCMYTIVAAEDCLVLRWSHEDMQALMQKSTDMRAALTRAMTAAVVGKGRRHWIVFLRVCVCVGLFRHICNSFRYVMVILWRLTVQLAFSLFLAVINFTVSRSNAKGTWSSWLDDWKHNAGAQVQIATDQTEDDATPQPPPPKENLPSYPIKRFR